jgi:hypothetical protein
MTTASSEDATRAFVEAHTLTGGFVLARPVDFRHRLQHGAVLQGLGRLAVVQGLLEAFAPLGVRREADVVVALTATVEQAVHLGLTLSQFKTAQPVGVAVGGGEVLRGPGTELHGLPVERVRQLVAWARPHELLMPMSVLEGITLPKGVGRYAAPDVLASEVGFSVTILRDFRDATPIPST